MKINRIALFEVKPWSLPSLAIAIGTKCSFVHAAVEINGVWYDASESRGNFEQMDTHQYSDRWCLVWEFEGDLMPYLQHMRGREYDWKGVIGWLFRFNDQEKFYCFEAVNEALKHCSMAHPKKTAVSGCDIREVFSTQARYQRFKDVRRA